MALTEEQKARYAAQKRERYANDPEFREKAKEAARRSHRVKYASNAEFREARKRYQSERYVNDPDFREAKKAYTRENGRKHDLKKRFGISLEQYDELLLRQNGVCAICKEPEPRGNLHVDHDHSTGGLRGLLCGKCNRALGMLDDDIARIIDAAAYLTRHALDKEVTLKPCLS